MAKATAPKKIKLIGDYKVLRTQLRLNQSQFWNRLGVTQSAGSRYESGRDVPKPTAILAHLIYVQKQEISAAEFI